MAAQKIIVSRGQVNGGMDNVNVLRRGFFAPAFSLPDTRGELFNLKENLGNQFICLCFFPDDGSRQTVGYLKDLNSKLPPTASGLEVRVVAICPTKVDHLRRLRERLNLSYPLLSDRDLKVSRRYYVVDTRNPKPSVYFSVFVIDEEGVIRHRVSEVPGVSSFDPGALRAEIRELV